VKNGPRVSTVRIAPSVTRTVSGSYFFSHLWDCHKPGRRGRSETNSSPGSQPSVPGIRATQHIVHTQLNISISNSGILDRYIIDRPRRVWWYRESVLIKISSPRTWGVCALIFQSLPSSAVFSLIGRIFGSIHPRQNTLYFRPYLRRRPAGWSVGGLSYRFGYATSCLWQEFSRLCAVIATVGYRVP